MAGPFDVEAVAKIEGRRDAAALDLVDDRPVVDTVNRDFAAVAFIVEAPAVFADIGDADGTHAEHPLGEPARPWRACTSRMRADRKDCTAWCARAILARKR